MKIKWNWGTGIVVAMLLFMIFILQFVYRVTFVDQYDHHLVSDDYYKDELHYQDEINKESNALDLKQNIEFTNTDQGLKISFPEDFEEEKIEGTIYFKRFSNEKLDFKKDIELTDHSILIPKEILLSGKWDIKIEWKYKDEEYLTKKSLFTN